MLDQVNEERDSHEFMDRFIQEAKRAAANLTTAPVALEREASRIEKQIANLLKLAENTPDSPSLATRLRELEAERERVSTALADASKNAKLKAWLTGLKPAEARKMIEGWVQEDGATVEERRAALAQIVDRIEFNLATGEGRVHYRLGVNGSRFKLATAARELGIPATGVKVATPRGFEPRLPP